MNKIKYILIALIAFVLLTGCSANANITINYDGSVNENIDVCLLYTSPSPRD